MLLALNVQTRAMRTICSNETHLDHGGPPGAMYEVIDCTHGRVKIYTLDQKIRVRS